MVYTSTDKSERKEIKRVSLQQFPLLGRVAYSKLLGLCVLNVSLMCSYELCSYWLPYSQNSYTTLRGAHAKNHNARAT